MTLAGKIAEIAESQIGVRETSTNGGAEIADYQRATWLPVGPWPWCAAFICWVVREAMDAIDANWTFKRPRTAGAWDLEKWCLSVDNSAKLKRKPTTVKRGDIVIFTFSHVGIAVGDLDANNMVATVEGNTNDAGSREGDGCYRKRRHLSKIRSVIRFTI